MDLTGLAAKDVGGDDQEQEATSSTLVQTKATESSSSQWTDEKHGLYLNSIESTFVEQLYKSLDTLDRTRDFKSSKNKQTGQFKVLREGHWSKLNFKRDVLENRQISHDSPIDLLDSPWIRHYSSNSIRKFKSSQGTTAIKSLASTEKNIESLQGDPTSEVTDQNFIDEDEDEEKAGRIHHEFKRCRTSTAFVDQVVPGGNAVQEDEDSSEDHLQREED